MMILDSEERTKTANQESDKDQTNNSEYLATRRYTHAALFLFVLLGLATRRYTHAALFLFVLLHTHAALFLFARSSCSSSFLFVH